MGNRYETLSLEKLRDALKEMFGRFDTIFWTNFHHILLESTEEQRKLMEALLLRGLGLMSRIGIVSEKYKKLAENYVNYLEAVVGIEGIKLYSVADPFDTEEVIQTLQNSGALDEARILPYMPSEFAVKEIKNLSGKVFGPDFSEEPILKFKKLGDKSTIRNRVAEEGLPYARPRVLFDGEHNTQESLAKIQECIDFSLGKVEGVSENKDGYTPVLFFQKRNADGGTGNYTIYQKLEGNEVVFFTKQAIEEDDERRDEPHQESDYNRIGNLEGLKRWIKKITDKGIDSEFAPFLNPRVGGSVNYLITEKGFHRFGPHQEIKNENQDYVGYVRSIIEKIIAKAKLSNEQQEKALDQMKKALEIADRLASEARSSGYFPAWFGFDIFLWVDKEGEPHIEVSEMNDRPTAASFWAAVMSHMPELADAYQKEEFFVAQHDHVKVNGRTIDEVISALQEIGINPLTVKGIENGEKRGFIILSPPNSSFEMVLGVCAETPEEAESLLESASKQLGKPRTIQPV